MKKVYIKPTMKIVASSPVWLLAGSPKAQVMKWGDSQLSREGETTWDDDEEEDSMWK